MPGGSQTARRFRAFRPCDRALEAIPLGRPLSSMAATAKLSPLKARTQPFSGYWRVFRRLRARWPMPIA